MNASIHDMYQTKWSTGVSFIFSVLVLGFLSSKQYLALATYGCTSGKNR